MSGTWATPDAEQVLPWDAPREVWLAERAKAIGGSDAAAVMGFNTWTSPREVYYDKRGLLAPKAQNEAMFWGTMLEDAIARGFAHRTGLKLQRRGLLRSKANPFMQVSVDRLTSDGGGLEVKNMGYFREDEWGDDDDPQIPDAAEIQAMHCMAVTGKDHWWVAGLINGNKLIIRRVERNQKTIDQIIALEKFFWENHVLAASPPPVDGSDACTKVLRKVYRNADPDEYVVVDKHRIVALMVEDDEAFAEIKAAKERRALVQNKIRDLAGTATAIRFPGEGGVIPDPVITMAANGTFSREAFEEGEPELAKEYTRPVTRITLDTVALKADKPEVHTRYRARPIRPTAVGKAAVKAAKEKAAQERAARAADQSTTTEQEVA